MSLRPNNATTELTFDIITRLVAVFRKAGVPVSRHEHVKGTGDPGILAIVLAIALKEITGDKVAVDHHLKDIVKLERWRTQEN